MYADSDARAAISVTDSGGDGSLSYNSSTGVLTYTGPSASEVRAHFTAGTGITITSGEIATTITQYADSDARAALSVTDSGGDGSLSYDNATGVFTYTGPSASEVRAHFTGGTGVTITSGSIAIGQAVGTTDNVTFNNVTVNGTLTSDDITSTNISVTGNATITGNLTVQGTTVTIDSTTVALGDNIIVLNKGETGSPTMNAGLEIERGTSDNATFQWNETDDQWEAKVGSTFATLKAGTLIGNVTGTITGNADTATTAGAWTTARTITLGGDLTGSVSIDGSADVTLTATVAANSVALGTDTTGDYVASMTAGTGITVGTATGEGSTPVIALSHLGIQSLTDPNADRILFWDDSAGAAAWLEVSTGLTLSGTALTNAGVTSITGTSNQVTASASTGSVTLSLPQSINTAASVQFGSFGVGTAASGTTGQIRATNEITAYYSDKRLKENITPIDNALEKVLQLHGVTYTANDLAESFGYTDKSVQVGLLAQEVQAVLPQVVVPAPFDITVKDGVEVSKSGEEYLTVKYEKIVALLVEAIKDLNDKVESLEAQLGGSKSL